MHELLFSGTSWEQVKQQVLEPGEENFYARQFISETTITAANDDITAYARQSFTPGRPSWKPPKT